MRDIDSVEKVVFDFEKTMERSMSSMCNEFAQIYDNVKVSSFKSSFKTRGCCSVGGLTPATVPVLEKANIRCGGRNAIGFTVGSCKKCDTSLITG